MANISAISQELKTVIASSLDDTGLTSETAARIASRASQAVCAYLMGTRVYFCKTPDRADRDKKIVETAKTASKQSIAAAANLSVSQVNRILKKNRRKA